MFQHNYHGLEDVGGRGGWSRNMALSLGPAASLLMFMSDDARFALGLVLLCRLAGVSSSFAAHPVFGACFQICILCLDSLFDLVTQSYDPILASGKLCGRLR